MANHVNDGGPAFPQVGTAWNEYEHRYELSMSLDGMSLRDYFAAKALVGLLAEPFSPGTKSAVQLVTGRSSSSSEAAEHFAEAAYALADAMLKARSA